MIPLSFLLEMSFLGLHIKKLFFFFLNAEYQELQIFGNLYSTPDTCFHFCVFSSHFTMASL